MVPRAMPSNSMAKLNNYLVAKLVNGHRDPAMNPKIHSPRYHQANNMYRNLWKVEVIEIEITQHVTTCEMLRIGIGA